MNTNEYLQKVLSGQDLKDDSTELKELQTHRAEVEALIRKTFGSVPTIRYGGSLAKGTLIRESYDLDVVCYMPCDGDDAGKTLEEIHRNVRDCLAQSYFVEEKTSALRLRGKDGENFRRDFHIDVVPGRFTDKADADCYIYQRSAEKCRLKTNLDVHIKYIRGSGVLDAIRLLKLWNARNLIGLKQFVFELLIIELLDGMESKPLADQLTHVWEEIVASADPISVEDPANPSGNDLTAVVKAAWPKLIATAKSTLETIRVAGWESVFGAVAVASGVSIVDRAQRAAASVSAPNKPWCSKG
ncbi:MAG TPA: nucleotidyltransferase [Bryobacteraceae bacterium]|jgi:hypothetical protein